MTVRKYLQRAASFSETYFKGHGSNFLKNFNYVDICDGSDGLTKII